MGFVLFVCFVPSIRHSSVSSVEVLSQHLRHSDANKTEQAGPVLYKFTQAEQAGTVPYLLFFSKLFKRKLFVTTKILLRDIAPAASIGCK